MKNNENFEKLYFESKKTEGLGEALYNVFNVFFGYPRKIFRFFCVKPIRGLKRIFFQMRIINEYHKKDF